MPAFADKLAAAAERNRSLLCVGLDPDPARMPVAGVAEFNRAIIDATSDLVCAYKPNLAFYEALGPAGLDALRATLDAIPDWVPVIADAKRGDLDNSSAGYARALFDVWDFDAATFHPYMGRDSLAPFLARPERGILVLCRTSNPSAREFQDLRVTPMAGGDTLPMYEYVAMTAVKWNDNGNVGLVVGATYPDELERVRDLCPDMPILIPGVGTQEGALERSVAVGVDERGRNAIVNASRGVIYAGDDPTTYPDAARNAAQRLRDTINRVLEDRGLGWNA
ncbi:MAG: orotidine-5'-phosphate decarboxylase [Chloroflexota bacterium]|nr:orotidine-5'-phosphate decarboxylase [Chloroflexota bacterium]